MASTIVAEMIPVVAPHALQRRKQIVAFVVATQCWPKEEATIWFYLAPTSLLDVDVWQAWLPHACSCVLMYKRQQQSLLLHQLIEKNLLSNNCWDFSLLRLGLTGSLPQAAQLSIF